MGKGDDDDGVRWPRNSTHEPTLNTFPWCFYVTKREFFCCFYYYSFVNNKATLNLWTLAIENIY